MRPTPVRSLALEHVRLLMVPLALGGCGRAGCCGPAPTPLRPSGPSVPCPTPQPEAPRRGTGALVVVDTSQSLAGFVQAAGRSQGGAHTSAMSVLHQQVIETALNRLRADAPLQRCLLDTELRCGAAPVPATTFDLASTYHGSDAALDRVLRMPESAPRPDAVEPDLLEPRAISILLTDGFQSAPTPSAGSPHVRCAGGADPGCLGALLADRVRAGYGVWVGRIYLPFSGNYYPERSIDGLWDGIVAHVDDLNRNQTAWQGVTFQARQARGERRANGMFTWSGARPLLMVVLSRNIALGRDFVARASQALQVERAILARESFERDVAFAELAPFETATACIDPSAIRRQESIGPGAAVRIAPAVRTARGVEVLARCTITGRASFSTRFVVARPPSVPAYVDVQTTWRAEGAPASWLTVTASGPQLVATIDCRRLPRGVVSAMWGVYAAWERRVGQDRQWVFEESAPTSYEAPEKVFRLRDLVSPALDLALNRQGWLDHLTVTVSRE
jgi:hypothetical protein